MAQRPERRLGLPASLVAFLLMSGAVAVLAIALFIFFDPRTREWLVSLFAAAWDALVAAAAAIAAFLGSLLRG